MPYIPLSVRRHLYELHIDLEHALNSGRFEMASRIADRILDILGITHVQH